MTGTSIGPVSALSALRAVVAAPVSCFEVVGKDTFRLFLPKVINFIKVLPLCKILLIERLIPVVVAHPVTTRELCKVGRVVVQ